MWRGTLGSCVAVLLCLRALPAGAQAASDTIVPPAYSAPQATMGATTYEVVCLSCHDDGYHTAPKFRQKWSGRSVYELFTTLRATMPDDNPGGLSNDEYVHVVAYILKMNGVPAGADSLAADSLRMSHMRMTLPADSARAGSPR